VTDTAEQTKRIMLALAEEDGPEIDLHPWRALQDWIWHSEHRAVVIPYGKRLARAIPPVAVRLRRDFLALLGLIRAHALLHQATRGTDERGRLVASIDDYTVVRGLVNDLFTEGLDKTVKPETRETVEKIGELNEGHTEPGVSGTELAAALNLDPGAVSRRVKVAIKKGYVVNLEERRGKRARYVVGEAMPENAPLLPEPAALYGDRCTVARLQGETPG
jgi:hypothetical protein